MAGRTIIQYLSSEDKQQAEWILQELNARGRPNCEIIQTGSLPTGVVGDTALLVGAQIANTAYATLVNLKKFSAATDANPKPLNQTFYKNVIYYGVGGNTLADTAWLRMYWVNSISPVGSEWLMNMEDGSQVRIGKDTNIDELNKELAKQYAIPSILDSIGENILGFGGIAGIALLAVGAIILSKK